MDGREFLDRVDAHPTLCFAGGPDESLIYIRNCQQAFSFPPQAVWDNDWQDLEAVLTGQSRLVPPHQRFSRITRILGYFSNIRNWNRSKLAELRDRRKGNYAVPEVAAVRDPVSSS